jgi:hypothetical protein
MTDMCEVAATLSAILVSLPLAMDSGTPEGKVPLRVALHPADFHGEVRSERQRTRAPKKPSGGVRASLLEAMAMAQGWSIAERHNATTDTPPAWGRLKEPA